MNLFKSKFFADELQTNSPSPSPSPSPPSSSPLSSPLSSPSSSLSSSYSSLQFSDENSIKKDEKNHQKLEENSNQQIDLFFEFICSIPSEETQQNNTLIDDVYNHSLRARAKILSFIRWKGALPSPLLLTFPLLPCFSDIRSFILQEKRNQINSLQQLYVKYSDHCALLENSLSSKYDELVNEINHCTSIVKMIDLLSTDSLISHQFRSGDDLVKLLSVLIHVKKPKVACSSFVDHMANVSNISYTLSPSKRTLLPDHVLSWLNSANENENDNKNNNNDNNNNNNNNDYNNEINQGDNNNNNNNVIRVVVKNRGKSGGKGRGMMRSSREKSNQKAKNEELIIKIHPKSLNLQRIRKEDAPSKGVNDQQANTMRWFYFYEIYDNAAVVNKEKLSALEAAYNISLLTLKRLENEREELTKELENHVGKEDQEFGELKKIRYLVYLLSKEELEEFELLFISRYLEEYWNGQQF